MPGGARGRVRPERAGGPVRPYRPSRPNRGWSLSEDHLWPIWSLDANGPVNALWTGGLCVPAWDRAGRVFTHSSLIRYRTYDFLQHPLLIRIHRLVAGEEGVNLVVEGQFGQVELGDDPL